MKPTVSRALIRWQLAAIVAALLVVFFCLTGCALLGATAGGAAAGGYIAGPQGAAAGAAGGAIGYGWTTIVNWWTSFWHGLFGAAPTQQQVKSVTDTFTVIKWIVVFAVGWSVLKGVLGPRYRKLMLGFLSDSVTAVWSFVKLNPKVAATKAKRAAKRAHAASGMGHSKDLV